MMLEVLLRGPDWTWAVTSVIGLFTLIMVRLLLQVWRLPPGPFPLPFIGNILGFRGEGNELRKVIERLQKKHKDMFTVWLGPRPSVFVCTWKLCQEALISKRNDFSGRVRRHTLDIVLNGGSDVAFTDYGPEWETLRKILSLAVRRYATSESLSELVCDVVDRTTETLTKDGKPVDSSLFMYLNIYNILATSAFGVRYEVNDPEFVFLRTNNDAANEKFANGLPSDALPFLKIFYRKRISEISFLIGELRNYVGQKLNEHEKTYQSGDVRDFSDAVIAAKEEALAEGKSSLPHLTPNNMQNVLLNFFTAGTDTTRTLLLWTFLFISNDHNIQRKVQEEIDQNIGSRLPMLKDKASCHFINAVITETLRFRSVLDFSLEHKAVFDTELGGYKIPKDTSVFFYFKSIHNDPNVWEEPDKFKPERFLDKDGKFSDTRLTNYLPFGLGRRACPGEKLALANSFLVTCRLLQKHNFDLEGGPGSGDLRYKQETFANYPHSYNLVIKRRDVN